jgi:hypothetical protein
MNLAQANIAESFETDDELMKILHESLRWQYLAGPSASAQNYTNLRGALEDLFESSQKGVSIAFLFNHERGTYIGVDQIKSLWKRIGLI